MSEIVPQKVCIYCNRLLPLSMFGKHKGCKDGHIRYCKDCDALRHGKKPRFRETAPVGFKTCRKCLKVFPATPEYFYRNKHRGLNCWCKNCMTEHITSANYKTRRRQLYHQRYKEYARNYAKGDKRKAYDKAYAKTEQGKATRKRYYTKPEVKVENSLRAALRREKSPDGRIFSKSDIEILMKSQKGLCWWCGKPVGEHYHVDHRIPLSKGGSNAPENLCISCPHCNLSKGAKLPQEWNGRLL